MQLSAYEAGNSGAKKQLRYKLACVIQVLHPDLLNENFRNAEYAVRGELYLKGAELKKAGRDIIFTNGVATLGIRLSEYLSFSI